MGIYRSSYWFLYSGSDGVVLVFFFLWGFRWWGQNVVVCKLYCAAFKSGRSRVRVSWGVSYRSVDLVKILVRYVAFCMCVRRENKGVCRSYQHDSHRLSLGKRFGLLGWFFGFLFYFFSIFLFTDICGGLFSIILAWFDLVVVIILVFLEIIEWWSVRSFFFNLFFLMGKW